MTIVFFGTPDFALPVLGAISESRHNISAVVTAPDKERGRGQKVSYAPVKEFALRNDIKCLQPETLKDVNFVNELRKINADLFVVVAFRILPREVYSIPPYGSFNLHGSLLPKYRGAAPIQWALINGDSETGVTTFFLEDKVDTGSIILKKYLLIDDKDNFGTLHDKMAKLGAEAVVETIDMIENGNVELQPQDNRLATPAPKITKEMCSINWNNPAQKIHNLVRGLTPFPGAYFETKDSRYKVYSTRVVENTNSKPGSISTENDKIIIGCAENELEILEIQPEGRKRMSSAEFLRGYKL
ncbi:MAG: methionyl-tRNA formyltransferase [Melioribacteraceae bacterium]|nr:methionyl-tRNA formyltransferase [Melioribacteraceae bacterium]